MSEAGDTSGKPCSESNSALLQGKPLRTWRPMILWSAAIVLALGLAWFVGAVAASVWQVRTIAIRMSHQPHPEAGVRFAVGELGGEGAAIRKVSLYLRLPRGLVLERARAVIILRGCGPEAVPVLCRHLSDPDAKVRGEVFNALLVLNAPLTTWVGAVMREGEPRFRAWIVWVLGEHGPGVSAHFPEAISLIEAARNDPDAKVRSAADEALKKVRGEIPRETDTEPR